MRPLERLQSLGSNRFFSPLQRIALFALAFVQRHPKLVALFGFVSGVASFVLVDRQDNFARVIPVLMLVSWMWLTLENVLNRGLVRWFGLECRPACCATRRSDPSGSLFFVPAVFFYVTTAWNSEQLVFSGLLLASALVAILDRSISAGSRRVAGCISRTTR